MESMEKIKSDFISTLRLETKQQRSIETKFYMMEYKNRLLLLTISLACEIVTIFFQLS